MNNTTLQLSELLKAARDAALKAGYAAMDYFTEHGAISAELEEEAARLDAAWYAAQEAYDNSAVDTEQAQHDAIAYKCIDDALSSAVEAEAVAMPTAASQRLAEYRKAGRRFDTDWQACRKINNTNVLQRLAFEEACIEWEADTQACKIAAAELEAYNDAEEAAKDAAYFAHLKVSKEAVQQDTEQDVQQDIKWYSCMDDALVGELLELIADYKHVPCEQHLIAIADLVDSNYELLCPIMQSHGITY